MNALDEEEIWKLPILAIWQKQIKKLFVSPFVFLMFLIFLLDMISKTSKKSQMKFDYQELVQ